MSNWVRALGEWWKWSMGESTLPGRRSRLYLAGTAATLTALAVLAVVAAGGGPAKVANSASLASTQVTAGVPFSGPVPTATAPSAAKATSTATGARAKAVHPSPAASAAVPPVSSAASGLVVGPGLVPGAVSPPPTALAVTAGKGWARLTWSPPTPGGGDPVDGYDVYVGTSPGGESPTPANGATLIPTTAYTVTHLVVGTTYYFTVRASGTGGLSDPSTEGSSAPDQSGSPVSPPATPVVGMAALPNGSGYWLVDARGTVSARGAAVDYGSAVNLEPGASVVQIAATPDGLGYWEAASDGEVLGFGDARVFGSASGVASDVPVIGLAPTRDGQGYWEVTSAGGVFSFGDAAFLGPIGGLPSAPPIVGIAADTATAATGWWPTTVGSSATAHPRSGRVPGRSSTSRSSGWPPPPTGAATGRWPATAASSPSATPRSSARRRPVPSAPRSSVWLRTCPPVGTGWWPATAVSSASGRPCWAPASHSPPRGPQIFSRPSQ